MKHGVYRIRKLFRFEAAHQLLSAVTACCHETIHGHSYRVEVFISRPRLNADSMVADFGSLDWMKEIIAQFDHALIMHEGAGAEYLDVLRRYNKKLLLARENPTAEWMAKDLYDRFRNHVLGSAMEALGMKLCVRVHETETGFAEYPVDWLDDGRTERDHKTGAEIE